MICGHPTVRPRSKTKWAADSPGRSSTTADDELEYEPVAQQQKGQPNRTSMAGYGMGGYGKPSDVVQPVPPLAGYGKINSTPQDGEEEYEPVKKNSREKKTFTESSAAFARKQDSLRGCVHALNRCKLLFVIEICLFLETCCNWMCPVFLFYSRIQ